MESQADDSESDESVIASVLTGDSEAFSTLVARHQTRLVTFLYGMVGNREDAEDLAQDAFVRAFRGLSSFENRSQFYTWLQRIAFNLMINHRRKFKRQTAMTKVDMSIAESDVPGTSADPAQLMQTHETRSMVQDAIHALHPERRAIIVMRDIQQLEYAEIALQLDIPVGTVRSRLHRARMELADSLKHVLGQYSGSES